MTKLSIQSALVAVVVFVVVAAGPAHAASVGVKNLEARPMFDQDRQQVRIVQSLAERKDDGSFMFAYQGEDGSFREEVGQLRDAGTEDEALEVRGSYRYIDADGQEVEVHYTAGRDGFVVEGTNIPREITLAARAAAEAARTERQEP